MFADPWSRIMSGKTRVTPEFFPYARTHQRVQRASKIKAFWKYFTEKNHLKEYSKQEINKNMEIKNEEGMV